MTNKELSDAIACYATCIQEAANNILEIAKTADSYCAPKLKTQAQLMRTTLMEVTPVVVGHFTPWQRMALQKLVNDKLEAVKNEKADPDMTFNECRQWIRDWEQLDAAVDNMIQRELY
jgi:flagellar biosynthesis/type III secretory pathway protein FliH